MTKSILSFLLMLLMISGFCQEVDSSTNGGQISFFDSSDAVLPILINAAIKNAPQMTLLNANRQDAEYDLALSKKEFLRDFTLHSGYNYGNYNNIFPESGGLAVPIYYSNHSTSVYSVGASVGISLEQIFGGKKLRVNKRKLAIQQTEAQMVAGEKEIRKQVISLYQSVKLSRVILLHSQDALQTAYVNKTLAEKQFKEGNLQVTEQMTVDQLYTNALLATEQAKNTYQTNLLLLEELAGIPVTPILNKYLNQ
jgi:outer membrane protein TolC